MINRGHDLDKVPQGHGFNLCWPPTQDLIFYEFPLQLNVLGLDKLLMRLVEMCIN